MQRVYVDASDKKKLITVVVEGEIKSRWASTLAYGEYKIQTHEAEYLGIIYALENLSGDLEIISDAQSIVRVLNGEGRITEKTKPYIEKVEKLRENRVVKFTYGSRDVNEASLKQDGYSLYEIRDAYLREMRQKLQRELKAKEERRRHKRRKNNAKRFSSESIS